MNTFKLFKQLLVHKSWGKMDAKSHNKTDINLFDEGINNFIRLFIIQFLFFKNLIELLFLIQLLVYLKNHLYNFKTF